MSDREDDEPGQSPDGDEIGYGNPPMQRRFKSGESGNRKGRPKGVKNRKTIVKAVANEMHTVTENGQRRRRSMLDLVLLRLRIMAVKEGNVRAFDEFHRLDKTYGPQEVGADAGYLVVPAEISVEEWVAEQEEKNKTRKPPPGYRQD